jgi:FkbM family methyltransferase
MDAGEGLKRNIGSLLRSADPEAWFDIAFNGVDACLPRDTLRTMVHCFHFPEGQKPVLLVETEHLKWMIAALSQGGTFLDVGASTGATTIPIALTYGPRVVIHAYEPATPARTLLERTLARNALSSVEVHGAALAGAVGTAEFIELGYDDTDQTPFLPEGSALSVAQQVVDQGTKYTVPVVTLDHEMPRVPRGPVVVKIDVEGFECRVIDGGPEFLQRWRPHLSIDIHPDPCQKQTTTEAEVCAKLSRLGYTFEKRNHVLLCTPPRGSQCLPASRRFRFSRRSS